MLDILVNTIVTALQLALFVGMGLGWSYVIFGFGHENTNR
jgi:hypothetical protein